MSILKSAQTRYSSKAFDPKKPLTVEQIDTLKEILRLSPSSINIQAWHFLVITSDEAKAKLAQSCPGVLEYNAKKILNAPMTVVFCAQTKASQSQVKRVLDQEFTDGRFETEALRNDREELMEGYLDKLNAESPSTIQAWLDKQTYIALGNALLAAADMGIDSVPVEGFDKALTDENFGLTEKGLHSTVLACFGYHSEDDFNAKLPKSRLPNDELFTEL